MSRLREILEKQVRVQHMCACVGGVAFVVQPEQRCVHVCLCAFAGAGVDLVA